VNFDLYIQLAYLLSAVLFILGLKQLSSPETARRGNRVAAIGMLLAVVATLLDRQIIDFSWILIGLVVGALIGAIMARTVKMTAMPQMVAVFNGFGGGASGLVAAAAYLRHLGNAELLAMDTGISIMAGTLIGGVTLSGSFVAFAKLQGIAEKAATYPLQKTFNFLLAAAALAVSVYLIISPDMNGYLILAGLALVLGILVVIPIGGADMPVVVALLNSYSGLAASAAGFVLSNNALIISGALVGASGLILTNIMCRAMNRSLANVLFGAFGAGAPATGPAAGADGEQVANPIDAEDLAMMLAYARSVVFVPGYGLAVAQAQHRARPHERAPGRGQRPVHGALRDRGHQPGHLERGCGGCRRSERRRQPGGAGRPEQRHRRHADRGGGQSAPLRRAQAQPEPRLRRHPEPALLPAEHAHVFRLGREVDRRPRARGEGAVAHVRATVQAVHEVSG
jgi:NAD(P) transhydrogenase subunit beta